MRYSNWTAEQFLDSNSLNTLTSNVSGDFNTIGRSLARPGLLFPEVASFSASGLVINSTLPFPFGVCFGSGTIAHAHGTVTGLDTTAYSTSFAAVVPASGAAVTAYLLAALGQITVSPFTNTGPPVGHPDYNPNFVPATAYATLLDTLILSASTTPPDNLTTFELGRTTLTSGATGVVLSTVFQQRLSAPNTIQPVQISVSSSLSPAAHGGRMVQALAPSTLTLSAASGSNGITYAISSATTGTVTVQAQGGDTIYGYATTASSGVTSLGLPIGGEVMLGCFDSRWQITGGNYAGLGGPQFDFFTSAGSPNGQTAGTAAASGFPPDLCWDTVNNLLYTCTQTGSSSTAVWVQQGRIKVTSPLTVFVATTGSDTTNTGLTSGSPFATVNKAWSTLQSNYDFTGSQSALIQVADGVYNQNVIVSGALVGPATSVTIQGNVSTPANCSFSSSSPFVVLQGAIVTVQGFKLSGTGALITGAHGGTLLTLGAMEYGASSASSQIVASDGATIFIISSNYKISGGAPGSHISASVSSSVNYSGTLTVAVSGNPNFAQGFVSTSVGGSINLVFSNITITGTATGPKFNASANGVINTSGSDPASYFPGDSAGVKTNGGQYV